MTRRRKSRQRLNLVNLIPALIVAALVAFYIHARGDGGDKAQTTPSATSTAYGDLQNVATAPGTPETIVQYTGMRISFNPQRHIPNWVAWELTRDEAQGTEPRSNNFAADPAVEGSATPADYRGSGYDRGHMAPAADMKWSPKAMAESFYMTNMCPQAKSLNTGAWKKLEEKCRDWALRDSAIVIICGPVATAGFDGYIGDSHVAVPRRFFKVILAPYATPPRGIAFIMDNGKVEGGIQRAAVSIDQVERLTGHDFFASLPDDIENDVESQCRFNYWSTLK